MRDSRAATRGPEAFLIDVLSIVEINADERIAAIVTFDLDDFDAAIAELDARYLAGEAAPHARTWSVIAGGHAALNRHELPPTTPDWVSIDHRRGAAFAPGDLIEYFRAGWELGQTSEPTSRLCIGSASLERSYPCGTWRFARGLRRRVAGVDLLTVEGDMVNRCEVFDEADLDAAIARFDQLSRPAPRLENAASQVDERFLAYFAARDWDAMAEMLADDFSSDDRRRVVNAGIRHGRDAEIAKHPGDRRPVGSRHVTSDVIATRGEHLVLTRDRYSRVATKVPRRSSPMSLSIVEIDADERIAAIVTFDLDDFDAAIAELDARYLAGEAAAHAHTWSVDRS